MLVMTAAELPDRLFTAIRLSPPQRKVAIGLAIFVVTLMAYYVSTAYLISPTNITEHKIYGRYQHHLYQADAILHGTLDIGSVGFPASEHDTITQGTAKYAPFPPGPSLLMLPFVAIFGRDFEADITGIGPLKSLGVEGDPQPASEIYFSMFIGALNVALFWYLLSLLRVSRWTKALMIPFFAFGTVHFFTATTGTAWHYAHTAAVFFLLLAIISMLRRAPPIVPALLLGFAFLSREPTILAAPFFGVWYLRQNHDSLKAIFNGEVLRNRDTLFQIGQFAAGLLPFVAFWFWYNAVRFSGPLDTGYGFLYENLYKPSNLYSFYRQIARGSPGPYDAPARVFATTKHFGQFDPRNIPLHLYSLLVIPPDYYPDASVFRPSPYGVGILYTSPAFIYAGFVKRKDALIPASWLAIGAICVPLFLHYSQGWVQFGYRFLLDFAPFLLILTALGIDDHTSRSARVMQVSLVGVAVVAGFWGRYWASALGW